MASKVDRRRRPRRKVVGGGYLSSSRDVSELGPPPPGPGAGVKLPTKQQENHKK